MSDTASHLADMRASGEMVSDEEYAARVQEEVRRDEGQAASCYVPTGELLDEVRTFLKRFVCFRSEAQAIAVALWVAHTHAIEAADTTPYLAITSPEKQSGKSRLLEVLKLLVARPWSAITPSEAVLYRKVANDCPSLLLDEVDAIFGPKAGQYESQRALLNAGYRRESKVPRCVGEGKNMKVEEFEVFCAKALAGIGQLPDTIADRAISIRLQRKTKGEHVERYRHRKVRDEAKMLRDAITLWAGQATETLKGATPSFPHGLSDRAEDYWEPLLAIADRAGRDWPQIARAAAVELAGTFSSDESLASSR